MRILIIITNEKIFMDKYTENYKKWLSIISSEKKLDEMFTSIVNKNFIKEERAVIYECLDYIKKKHHNQFRREGIRYYTHPLTVALFVLEYSEIKKEDKLNVFLASLLHDVLEDTNTPYSEIYDKYDEEVTEMVELLSKEVEGIHKDKFKEYYPKIKENKKALIIKACDRLANLHSLYFDNKEPEKKTNYIKKTYNEIIPIIKGLGELYERIKNALQFLQKTR